MNSMQNKVLRAMKKLICAKLFKHVFEGLWGGGTPKETPQPPARMVAAPVVAARGGTGGGALRHLLLLPTTQFPALQKPLWCRRRRWCWHSNWATKFAARLGRWQFDEFFTYMREKTSKFMTFMLNLEC